MTDTPREPNGANGAGHSAPIILEANLPATLADVEAARLPAVYEAAREAVAKCERVDECKSWSNRAEALASYARQARDDSLRVMAVRIQARAERRAGELLKQLPSGSGANLVQHRKAGAHPSVTRTQEARAAGLSAHQQKTAIRLASIPEPEFNRRVEAASPPTVTALAKQGTASRGTSTPASYPTACVTLFQFARFCERTDAAELSRMVDAEDREAANEYVVIVERWLVEFSDGLRGNED